MTCLSSSQTRFYAAARIGQSLAQPLAGLKLSPGAAHSYQDVHVCWRDEGGCAGVGWVKTMWFWVLRKKDIRLFIERLLLVFYAFNLFVFFCEYER